MTPCGGKATPAPPHRAGTRRGFSLIELLVSMTVVALLIVLLGQVLGDTQSVWQRSRTRAVQFRDARAAFESIARRLSQATLNATWGYRRDAAGLPVLYERESGLHFVCGPAPALLLPRGRQAGHGVFFQAPLNMTNTPGPDQERLEDLLNAWGYFVEFNSDLSRRPAFLAADTARNPERRCFRLMEFRLPTEKLNLFRTVEDPARPGKPGLPWIEAQTTKETLYGWFVHPLTTQSEPVADHVLALFIRPLTPTLSATAAPAAPDQLYDTRRHQWESPGKPASPLANATRHQLPPELRLTLVALDPASWLRLSPEQAEALSRELIPLVNRTLFQNPDKFDADLEALGRDLRSRNLPHRIFHTAVAVRSARWTTSRE